MPSFSSGLKLLNDSLKQSSPLKILHLILLNSARSSFVRASCILTNADSIIFRFISISPLFSLVVFVSNTYIPIFNDFVNFIHLTSHLIGQPYPYRLVSHIPVSYRMQFHKVDTSQTFLFPSSSWLW